MTSLSAAGIPIALSTVRVQIGADGTLDVTVDDEAYATPLGCQRSHLRTLLQDLARELGPIRVEIIEANGDIYVDIETPRDDDGPDTSGTPVERPPQRARGPFQAGEDVLIAVVIDRREPDADGSASLRLPPAITHRYGTDVYLIGRISHRVVPLIEVEAGHP